MASTFENNLRLEEIGTGEQSGTWGTKTNVNLELITDGLSYSSTGEAIANASTHTITMADGVADEFRSFYLKCTGGGQACTVTLAPNTLSKVWVIENTTSYTLTFSQGSGANVAILAGQVKMIATDGAGSGAAVFDLMQDLAVPDLFVDDDLKLQSDGAILSFGADGDTTLTHTDGSGLTLNSANKIMFRDSAISVSSSADATLDLAADGDINLTAGVDINIPANVGLTFGDDGEKIEGDGTDLTIASSNLLNLSATTDVVIPTNVGLHFTDANEKIESDGTDLTVTSTGLCTITATGNTVITNNALISGNLVLTGDLTVNGSTSTVSSVNTTIADNIIELNTGISASSNDAGIIIERGSTGNNAAIIWDESADKFTMGTTTATAADKSGGISVSVSTLVANLEGTATAAQYSDVAERFASDSAYTPGTVVALGGAQEITQVNEEASDEVFGVVSSLEQAAFKMNGGAGNDNTHPYIAMTGRVDVKVIGTVNKGDRLISASVPGYARAATKAECTAFNVIGRALTSKTTAGPGSVLAAVRTSH